MIRESSMKKSIVITGAVICLSVLCAIPAFAGFRRGTGSNGAETWYDFGDQTYPRDGWYWLDDDGDGTAECYCFDEIGWLYDDCVTPDGYTVNKKGAWIDQGQVVTRATSLGTGAVEAATTGTYTVRKGGFHRVNIPSDMSDISDKYTRFAHGADFMSSDSNRLIVIGSNDWTGVRRDTPGDRIPSDAELRGFPTKNHYPDIAPIVDELRQYPSGLYLVREYQNGRCDFVIDGVLSTYSRVVVAVKCENMYETEITFFDNTGTLNVDEIMNSMERYSKYVK